MLNNDGAQTGHQPTGSFNADGKTWFFIHRNPQLQQNLIQRTIISMDSKRRAQRHIVCVSLTKSNYTRQWYNFVHW